MGSSSAAPEFDISPERAIELLIAAAPSLPSERLEIAAAAGRVLAAEVTSLVDRPAADDSALDGFACLVSDTTLASEASPVRLELIGSAAAGRPFAGLLAAGKAVRVATGGLVPRAVASLGGTGGTGGRSGEGGTELGEVGVVGDTGVLGEVGVVGIEHASVDDDGVVLTRQASTDAVRPRGQDLRLGNIYLRTGRLLDGAAVGLVAAMGHPRVSVKRRPRLLLVATGDEIVMPGEAVAPGGLYDANGVALAAAAAKAGAVVIGTLHVADDKAALAEALDAYCEASEPPDLFVTSGGVSRGERDIVRDLMHEHGDLSFWRVSVRPAGPTLFGHYRGVPLLGLPGNPVSALIGFLLFARAFIDTALGRGSALPYYDRIPVSLNGRFEPQTKTILHRAHLEVVDGRLVARAFDNQSSGVLRSLVEADALVVTAPLGDAGSGHAPGSMGMTGEAESGRGHAIALKGQL